MAETKRIMISLPDSLLEEIDGIVSIEKKNRSEFIREAMKLYIRERKKMEIREELKTGYREMAQLNLALAEIGIEEDFRELCNYEDSLTGCGTS
ncbi:CopG family ribbon-helix-helix protein [Dethiothermospora halolimnae]|uniref:CopG family ribbon-helix-helix protein n=1 Tax=Dethiothermospora halolimnae TaxID=3114390 RepID=UPI003CCBFA2F